MGQATFFKTFTASDKTSTRTLLHEVIPITGSILSGSYEAHSGLERGVNVKSFSHGMFLSVYDYPYLSSSANQIFDVTTGVGPVSSSNGYLGLYPDDGTHTARGAMKTQKTKKINIFNQMAQILNGYDTSGSIRQFDRNGDFTEGDMISDPIFLNFSRLLVKDEIKKGTFTMKLGVNQAYATPFAKMLDISDLEAENNYNINSPAGEFGVLYASSSAAAVMHEDVESTSLTDASRACGLIYYQAGIVVLDGTRLFHEKSEPDSQTNDILMDNDGFLKTAQYTYMLPDSTTLDGISESNILFPKLFISGTIEQVADSVLHRINNISFNNTTELNSRIYFCRGHHNEFNYSSNPTYLSGSHIRVKNNDVLAPPRAFVTTVGLYSGDNELLAVAKLSEPIRKDPGNEITLRVRLDY